PGWGKPLKLINHRVRERIPIFVAGMGPKNVEMVAELAEGWEPIFYFPERAAGVWDAPLAAGRARRDPALPPLDVVAQAGLAIGADVGGGPRPRPPRPPAFTRGRGPPPGHRSNVFYRASRP